uniref:Serpentine receptor class gamma n=1 Tax=Steinernema glaseri TaxID=37863 RepID=A0A1I8ACV2_9BILA
MGPNVLANLTPHANLTDLMPLPTNKVPYVDKIELAVNLFAPFVSGYFLFLLRRPVFHLNLRILLGNFSLILSGLTISRSIILIYIFASGIEKPPSAVQIIHDSFVQSLQPASILMAGERCIATLFVDIYEKVKGWRITVAACAVTYILTLVLSYLCMVWRENVTILENGNFVFQNPSHRSYIAAVSVTLLFINIVGFLMFVFIYRYNRRRWSIDLSKKLGHRYQISENIRTSRQLFMVLIGDFVICSYFFLVVFYIFVLQRSDVTADIVAQLLDLGFAVAAIVMPMIFIIANPKLRALFIKHFHLGDGTLNWTRKSISNKPMVFATAAEGQMYFKQLERSWDNRKG